ncbi:MAG: type V CRISPR-associated protein Cas12a/Cpf1, partial [Clostridiales bacterium]
MTFCRDLIDYFKNCIAIHPEWKNFGFDFSDTSTYEDISGFYREVELQGYKIDWTYISEKDIDLLQEKGQLYLFQIYNKDFSKKSTGNDNLHTMYLKNLFSEENLKDIVLKLNGKAEIFFRKSSIKNPIIHKKGSILVNRTYEAEEKDQFGNTQIVRKTIPENIYQELYKYFNDKSDKELSDEAAKLKNVVGHHVAATNIVKDYRYTYDKYFLHMPITINFKANKTSFINDRILEYIAKEKDLHVIGIDRGERNLIYVSVIDTCGNIVEQKSFNIVNGYDYQIKLKQQEGARQIARKEWKEIGKIKEIKEGYLSLVIHEISKMVIKYNAIIAMEDLSYGFKKGRFKVERQVYQKFETMLINKLNYLVFKDISITENGGLLK